MINKNIYMLALMVLLPFSLKADTAVVRIDTGLQKINALEASILLPEGMSIESIETGNSMVLIWVNSPHLDKKTNTISFTGLSPGGFSGTHDVLTLVGEFSDVSISQVKFPYVLALANDGEGTRVTVELNATRVGNRANDVVAPTPFTPVIGRDPDISGSTAFVSFMSQDKEGGVVRYEYATTFFGEPGEGEWKEAVSPIVLTRTEMMKKVFIRAVDQSGNTQTTQIPGPEYYERIIELVIIIIIAPCVLYFRKLFF